MRVLLPKGARRRLPDRPFGRARAGIRSRRDEARPRCARPRETDRAHAPESVARVRSGRRGPPAPAHPHRGNVQVLGRGDVSTPRIPTVGSRRATAATKMRAVRDPRRAYAPRRPMYRGRSTAVAVVAQFVQDRVEPRDGPARRRSAGRQRWRRDPALADRIGQQRVARCRAATGRRRNEFGDDLIAVGHQYGFSRSSRPDVLAEPIFQHFDADDSHGTKVATHSYFDNPQTLDVDLTGCPVRESLPQ